NAGGAVVQVLMRSDFSQPKHSFVIMVATPFWNSGTSGTPEAIWSTTNVDLPRPSVRCAPPISPPLSEDVARKFLLWCDAAQTRPNPSGHFRTIQNLAGRVDLGLA